MLEFIGTTVDEEMRGDGEDDDEEGGDEATWRAEGALPSEPRRMAVPSAVAFGGDDGGRIVLGRICTTFGDMGLIGSGRCGEADRMDVSAAEVPEEAAEAEDDDGEEGASFVASSGCGDAARDSISGQFPPDSSWSS